MANLYKPFFLFYGGVHLAGGVLIALFPPVLSGVLSTSLETGAAMLLGFTTGLAGLGFLGGAFAESLKTKQIFVKLAIVGNVLTFLAHVSNALRGFSPTYMAIGGTVGVALMIGVLLMINRGLQRLKVR